MLAPTSRAPKNPRRGRHRATGGNWRPFSWALAVVLVATTAATDASPLAQALTGAPAEADVVDDEGSADFLPPLRLPATVAEALAPFPDGPWSTLAETLPQLGPALQPLRAAFASAISGVPFPALAAYRSADDALADADPSCRLDWSLLAGIGRIESNHGRYGGATLGADGVSRPAIIGIPLDGRPGVARITDTDGGLLDGDDVFDRAVGPMQFIPGTWATLGSDGDGDGVADPHDLDDAAMSAAAYLCAGSGDLSTESGARAALLRYNHSDEYATDVLTWARAYRDGTAADDAGPEFVQSGGTSSARFATAAFVV